MVLITIEKRAVDCRVELDGQDLSGRLCRVEIDADVNAGGTGHSSSGSTPSARARRTTAS